tara:strand:+ start:20 stop:151 length:132 start_codon:yes stop_codon:yes gene_type:complete
MGKKVKEVKEKKVEIVETKSYPKLDKKIKIFKKLIEVLESQKI